MSKPEHKKRAIATFSKRGKRKLSPYRKGLVEKLLPEIIIEADKLPQDIFSLFPGNPQKIWLEIGFGAGEHVAKQAGANPDVGIIGCEVFDNGISSLLRYIDADKLENVHIFNDDARLLMEKLPDKSIERIFILFPDPWPKKKHHKRRLISAENIKTLARLMKKGGKLRIATDHMPYAQWILVHMQNQEYFSWDAERAKDWLEPPQDHFTTRYEQKRKTGDTPLFFDYTRL